MRLRVAACLTVMSLFVSAPGPARAAGPSTASAADRAAARSMAEAGYAALQAGDYAGAIERFQRAEATFHASTNLLFLGRAYEHQGKLLDARRVYLELVAEVRPKDAPKAFRDAQTNASTFLVALDAKLSKVGVKVVGAPAGTPVEVTVDGARADRPADTIVLEPGRHVFVAVAGPERRTSEIVVEPGATSTVTLDFTPAPVAAPVTAPPKPPPPASDPGPLASPAPMLVAFGVGALGLGLGVGTGAASLGKVHDLKAACPTNPCSPANQSLADSARTLGTVSTIGFVLAGVGAAAGVTLFELRRARLKQATEVAVRATPATLLIEGAF
jgi:hypothetical protein